MRSTRAAGRASAGERPRTGAGEHRRCGVALRRKTRRVGEDVAGVGDWAGGLELTVCVLDHKELKRETLSSILRSAQLSREDLEALE